MKKRYTILFSVLAILAFGAAFPFLRAGFQIREYVRFRYQHFEPYVKLFAVYNPVDGAFNMRITDNSGEELFLECLSDGRIIDEARADIYMGNRSIPKRITVDEASTGTLHCYWKYNAPGDPLFLLSIHERGGIPVTTEGDLEAVLKERMLAHYEQLPDIVRDQLFRCHTAHQTDSAMYRITVFPTEDVDFGDLLQRAEMEKEPMNRHS